MKLRAAFALAVLLAALACTAPDYSFAPAAAAPDAGDASSPPQDGGGAEILDAGACRDAEVPVGGHCYSFTAGLELCTTPCPVGRIAVFETEDEAVEVAKALGRPPAGTRYYIGMYPADGRSSPDRASFRWIDDAAVTYSHWAPNEPSGTDGATCVLQDVIVDAATEPFPAWFDHQRTDPKYLLCERVP